MHECPDCGLAHDEPARAGPDPVVKVAEIEANRDIEVAKIQAGVTRAEMDTAMAELRAELHVRREEPPVAETEITQVTETDVTDPDPGPIPVAGPEAEPEPAPEPPETEPPPNEEQKGGWWGSYA